MADPTTKDSFLWYNVGDWAPYGLAVPNWSNDVSSINDTIRGLVEVAGRNLQALMWHTDASLRVPPSINTCTRIWKLCNRVRSIMAGRAVPPGTAKMETVHALPAAEEFIVFPTPYFRVRNGWMKQYAGLALLALTDAIQHTENRTPLEITTTFAGQFGQYFQRILRLMATELFQVPLAEAEKPDFVFTDELLASYDPGKWFTQTEMIDTVPPLASVPTEDELEILTNGIPISRLPVLPRWPTGPSGNVTGGSSTSTTGAAFVPAPGP